MRGARERRAEGKGHSAQAARVAFPGGHGREGQLGDLPGKSPCSEGESFLHCGQRQRIDYTPTVYQDLG